MFFQVLLTVILSALALLLVIPTMMSVMMFDSPGSTQKFSILLAFFGILSFTACTGVLALWSWGALIAGASGPSLLGILSLLGASAAAVIVGWMSS